LLEISVYDFGTKFSLQLPLIEAKKLFLKGETNCEARAISCSLQLAIPLEYSYFSEAELFTLVRN